MDSYGNPVFINNNVAFFRKILLPLSFIVIGFCLIFWQMLFGPFSFIVSSIMLLLMLAFVAYQQGVLSISFTISCIVIVPALSFFWSKLNGGIYIAHHNFTLQGDHLLVNFSVYIVMVAFFFTMSLLCFHEKKEHFHLYRLPLLIQGQWVYLIASIASAFFFWLAEPVLGTIFSGNYVENLKDGRIEGTQFAAGLALLCWLLAFAIYVDRKKFYPLERAYKWLNSFFLIITAFDVIWLILHARRSELLGMFLVLVLVNQKNINTRKNIIIGGLLFFLLIVMGEVRDTGMSTDLSQMSTVFHEDGMIVVLPGGASNVCMTLLDTIDYVSNYSLLAGETFFNYFLQILPMFFYTFLNIQIPEYFYQKVLENYSYNGGTYVFALFYGNFGLIGVPLCGLFIGCYILFVEKYIGAYNIVIRICGLYLVAGACRGFWYEMITIIKPIVILILPSYLLLKLTAKNKHHTVSVN